MTTVEVRPLPFGVCILLPDDVALAAVEQLAVELSAEVAQDLTVLAEASLNVQRAEGGGWRDLCDPLSMTAEGCLDRMLVVRDDAYSAFGWLGRPQLDLSATQALDLADALIAAVRVSCPALTGQVA